MIKNVLLVTLCLGFTGCLLAGKTLNKQVEISKYYTKIRVVYLRQSDGKKRVKKIYKCNMCKHCSFSSLRSMNSHLDEGCGYL